MIFVTLSHFEAARILRLRLHLLDSQLQIIGANLGIVDGTLYQTSTVLAFWPFCSVPAIFHVVFRSPSKKIVLSKPLKALIRSALFFIGSNEPFKGSSIAKIQSSNVKYDHLQIVRFIVQSEKMPFCERIFVYLQRLEKVTIQSLDVPQIR